MIRKGRARRSPALTATLVFTTNRVQRILQTRHYVFRNLALGSDCGIRQRPRIVISRNTRSED